MKEIKIVNIKDIEDLVLAKYEIETFLLKNKIIEEKYKLDNFVDEYISNLKYIYTYYYNNIIYSFSIYKCSNNIIYIFNIDIDNLDILNKLVNFVLNNSLQKINIKKLNIQKNPYIMHNNNIYDCKKIEEL